MGYLHLSAPARLQEVMDAIGISAPAFTSLGAAALKQQPPLTKRQRRQQQHQHQRQQQDPDQEEESHTQQPQHRWPEQWVAAPTDVHDAQLYCLGADSGSE